MAFRAIIFVALCHSAAMRSGISSAAETPPVDGGGGGGDGSGSGGALSTTAEELSPEDLQQQGNVAQSAQATAQFHQAVAEHHYISDRNSAPCADWAVLAIDFRGSALGAGLIAGPYEFFVYNRDSRPNPRGCAMEADRSAGAEAVHVYPNSPYAVLATHFYRVKATAVPTASGRQYALNAVVDRAKLCVRQLRTDPGNMDAVAKCAEGVIKHPGGAPWAAYLLVSSALARSAASSVIPASLFLAIEKSDLVLGNPQTETTFYVLPR